MKTYFIGKNTNTKNNSNSSSNYKGEVFKINDVKVSKNGNHFYFALIKSDKGKKMISVFFWNNKLSAKEWNLIGKVKKDDIIEFSAFFQGNYLLASSISIYKEKSSWLSVSRKLKGLNFCFLDIETSFYNEIIEIGYIILKNDIIVKKNSFLIRPPSIFKLFGKTNIFDNIKVSDLRISPKIEDIIPILKKDSRNCVIVSHNLKSFDYHHLKRSNFFSKNRIYYFYDTLPPSKEMIKSEKWEGKADLENMIRNIRGDMNFKEFHRSLPDSFLHLELFKKLIENKNFLEVFYKVH